MENSTKTKRSIKIALGLSVALNLLFVGVMGGAFWRSKDAGIGAARGMQSYAAPYVRALPKDDRRALHKAIRATNPLMSRDARRAVYTQMLATLRNEPFDAGAAQAVLEGQGNAMARVQKAAQEQWLLSVTAMSTAERAAYADRLEEALKRGPRKGRKTRKSPD